MGYYEGKVKASGKLSAKVTRAAKAPLLWRIANTLRWGYIKGWIATKLVSPFANWWGLMTGYCELEARLIKADGTVVNYGIIARRVVTDAGVGFIVDDWDDSTTDITNFNYHASGTGGTAENQTDTALVTEATTVTDRATGTKSQPAANQLRTVGTQAFTGSAAIVEHGIFSVVTESTGVLWDRSVFSAINVGNGDSIEWTHTTTLPAGS